jgi:hypothetical protein
MTSGHCVRVRVYARFRWFLIFLFFGEVWIGLKASILVFEKENIIAITGRRIFYFYF